MCKRIYLLILLFVYKQFCYSQSILDYSVDNVHIDTALVLFDRQFLVTDEGKYYQVYEFCNSYEESITPNIYHYCMYGRLSKKVIRQATRKYGKGRPILHKLFMYHNPFSQISFDEVSYVIVYEVKDPNSLGEFWNGMFFPSHFINIRFKNKIEIEVR